MNNQDNQNQIQKVVALAAPVDRVWNALVDHRQFGEWFRVDLDNPFEVGVTTTGRMTFPGHEHVTWESVTEAMVPMKRFAFSWPPSAVDPATEYPADAKVMVEFIVEATERGTQLTIMESGFEVFPETTRLDVLRSNAEGWAIQSANIRRYVER
ncbi:MAG: SRPBCC family protein [Pseudomonadota bacterium]